MSSIRREFTKTLFQKRTYIGWVGLFIIPFLIMLAFRFSNGGPGDGPGAQQDVGGFIFGLVRTNGMFLIVAALTAMGTFFLPMLASMSGSYSIAGEAENGTLRTMLMQPVRRGTLLMSKWLVANIYMAICLFILGIAALIAGGAVFGLKATPLFTGQIVGVWHALGLAAASYAFVFIGMMCVVSLAVLFSTFTNSSLTAVAGRVDAGHQGLHQLRGVDRGHYEHRLLEVQPQGHPFVGGRRLVPPHRRCPSLNRGHC